VEPISFDGTEEKKNTRSGRRRTISNSPPKPARSSRGNNRSSRRKTRQVGDSIANEEDFDSDMEVESYGEAESSQVESAIVPTNGKAYDRMGVFTGNQPDTDWQFIDDKRKVADIMKKYPECDSLCFICKRADKPLVGPFCKYEGKDIVGEPIFLHKDCIEVNQFSYFRISDS
jgi:hypothetical protein